MALNDREVQEGLDFILSHLCKSVFPRAISTKTTEYRQVLANSREEALARFRQSNYLDCRISAYGLNADKNPSAVARFQGIKTATPANILLMIDLDRCYFKSERALNLALNAILKNIKEKLGVNSPTVLWSGRGHHIIQPLDSNGIILEYIKQFENVQQPSLKFLRFTEWLLSNGKSDLQHNNTVSFGNCMLRIPGSINSKCGKTIKIVKMWNGYRPQINYLLRDFRRYLIDHKIQQLKEQQNRSKSSCLFRYRDQKDSGTICWIEKLLYIPINDYRKLTVWCILAPYLVNVKKLSDKESFDIINQWLLKCNKLKRLDFNPNQKIKEGLRGAAKGYYPISLTKLIEELPALYNHIQAHSLWLEMPID
jgi:hypothetical protein